MNCTLTKNAVTMREHDTKYLHADKPTTNPSALS